VLAMMCWLDGVAKSIEGACAGVRLCGTLSRRSHLLVFYSWFSRGSPHPCLFYTNELPLKIKHPRSHDARGCLPGRKQSRRAGLWWLPATTVDSRCELWRQPSGHAPDPARHHAASPGRRWPSRPPSPPPPCVRADRHTQSRPVGPSPASTTAVGTGCGTARWVDRSSSNLPEPKPGHWGVGLVRRASVSRHHAHGYGSLTRRSCSAFAGVATFSLI